MDILIWSLKCVYICIHVYMWVYTVFWEPWLCSYVLISWKGCRGCLEHLQPSANAGNAGKATRIWLDQSWLLDVHGYTAPMGTLMVNYHVLPILVTCHIEMNIRKTLWFCMWKPRYEEGFDPTYDIKCQFQSFPIEMAISSLSSFILIYLHLSSCSNKAISSNPFPYPLVK